MEVVVDGRQDTARFAQNVRRLEVGDDQITTDEGLVILVEEKRARDLSSSYRSRRLQKQLRRMLTVNEKGVNVLALRGRGSVFDEEDGEQIAVDLLKWQALGGYIGLLPESPKQALRSLASWGAVLRPGRALLSIVAGTDRERLPPMSVCAIALHKLVRGVGPKLGAELAAHFKHDILRALGASDAEWVGCGANKTVVKNRRALLEGGEKIES